MDRPISPLFRQVAIEAASGTQIGAALTTRWRGVTAFTLLALVLLAALIAFVALVEYSPVHRVAAFVDARGGLVRLKAPLDGRVTRLAVTDGAIVRKGDVLAVIGSERASGELNRLRVQSGMNAEHVVRASQDGRVSFASLAEGQTVEAGQPLFTIAPQDDPLVVKLLVAPAAVASLRPGVALKLAFRAYPQERFGLFDAKIESVNEIPSLPGEVPQAAAGGSEPMFLATAPLPGTLRGTQGEVLPLKPGMVADALVPIERRTVLEWLLDPVLRGPNESVGRGRAAADAGR